MPAGTSTANETIISRYTTRWNGADHNATLHLSGTFDGATVTVYRLADGSSTAGPNSDGWVAINGGAYTAADDDVIHCLHKSQLRVIITGGNESTQDIDYSLT